MSVGKQQVIKTAPLEDKDARWTKLVLTTYLDPNGQQRTWESAERRTRPKGSEIDGVGIVAIIQKETGPEILLQKQYRPPIDKVCIEVPAGLIDANETPEQAAVRELKEETGYVATVSESSPAMFNGIHHMFHNPGFTNTNLRMIHVTIDMNNPANKAENLKPELEDNEFIEIFTVPLKNMWEEMKKLEKEGFAIDARVGTMAEGIELSRRWLQ